MAKLKTAQEKLHISDLFASLLITGVLCDFKLECDTNVFTKVQQLGFSTFFDNNSISIFLKKVDSEGQSAAEHSIYWEQLHAVDKLTNDMLLIAHPCHGYQYRKYVWWYKDIIWNTQIIPALHVIGLIPKSLRCGDAYEGHDLRKVLRREATSSSTKTWKFTEPPKIAWSICLNI